MNTRSLPFWIRRLSAGLWLIALSTSPAQTGVPVWTNRYSGSANGNDVARALAVDRSGNVIVAGYIDESAGTPNGIDFLTIKYSGAGVPIWTNRYNGPASGPDNARAVAVDDDGNVFVTGSSWSSTTQGSGRDFATLKYSGAGVPLWTNRYAAGGEATALAVDQTGNVFVTGWSWSDDTTSDYATVAYSGAGVPLWTNWYNGPGDQGDNGDDARALAVDQNGNVFVTGWSKNGPGVSFGDCVTIKYSGAGVPLWTNRYGGPGYLGGIGDAIVVDGSGNVIVTGPSSGTDGPDQYTTIKYSGTGAPIWTNHYNGPVGGGDEPKAIAADSNGNVIVTGYSQRAPPYNDDYATIKYTSGGVPLWTNRYNGPGDDDDRANAVAVDQSGNVFVTGLSHSSEGNDDFATIKYSSAGVPLWTNRYIGPSGYNEALALALDGNGSAIVTGFSYGSAGADYATIKYSGETPFPIPLNFQSVGNQLVLSWTNSSFSLQSAPAAQGAYTSIVGAISPHTNAIVGAQRYFRLIGN